jgi:CheY-like chemotaxis protein
MNIESGSPFVERRPAVAGRPALRRRRERRHTGRVETTGTVVVHADGVAFRARIVDLAIGSVSVRVASTAQPPSIGTRVRVDLRVDGMGRWIHLHGHIHRVVDGAVSSELVIDLEGVPPSFEDLVQDELLAALECARTPHVLLVDIDRGRRELVAAAFRVIGVHVIEATSPIEAIADLDESQLHPWAIAIADSDLDASAVELRRFIGEIYPCVPLIAIGRLRHAGASASLVVDEIPDLALQVLHLFDIHSVANERMQ